LWSRQSAERAWPRSPHGRGRPPASCSVAARSCPVHAAPLARPCGSLALALWQALAPECKSTLHPQVFHPMRVLTVIGNRPQFVKAAAVSTVLRERADEILVHTGQRYGRALSDVFFEELGVPPPDHELGVGSGSHAEQTGAIMTGLEPLVAEIQPDAVLVYGDTNSTLGGALVAAKAQVPL